MPNPIVPDLAQVRELVEALRALGVTRFKSGDLEVELGPPPPPRTPHVPPRGETPEDTRTPDQILDDKLFGRPIRKLREKGLA